MKTWLEVAINGPWGPKRQPGSPTSIDDCVAEGVRCVEAGAAIVHVHAFDAISGKQNDDPEVYAAIIEDIRTQTGAIVYPSIALSGAPFADAPGPRERFAHQDELGRRGLLEWAVVDPGTVNFSSFAGMLEGDDGFVYMNPVSHVRAGLEVTARYGSSPAFAIYEPGFIRLGSALAAQYEGISQPIYRFMFSDKYTFGYPPKPFALDGYVRLLDESAPGAPWMVSGLGVNILPLIPEAVEGGGHVRVGLEDMPLGCGDTNPSLVQAARRAVEEAGSELASPADVRRSLQRAGNLGRCQG